MPPAGAPKPIKPAKLAKPARPAKHAAPTPAGSSRPVLLVLAGVNGAGKSSIGGNVMLRRAGLSWFNPDHYTRLLVEAGVRPDEANARAWQHGVDLLDEAVAHRHSHAMETTLGGQTMTQKIADAARTHDVLVWYCGLASAEQHIARVTAWAAAGGHDIPQDKIGERWVQAPLNLIALMPHLGELRVFDNSAQAAPGSPVADPVPLLHVRSGQVQFPATVQDLERTPDWAKPIVMAARQLSKAHRRGKA
jgi:predicted ABC-type ATPase